MVEVVVQVVYLPLLATLLLLVQVLPLLSVLVEAQERKGLLQFLALSLLQVVAMEPLPVRVLVVMVALVVVIHLIAHQTTHL